MQLKANNDLITLITAVIIKRCIDMTFEGIHINLLIIISDKSINNLKYTKKVFKVSFLTLLGLLTAS